jgi:hypothetical protein
MITNQLSSDGTLRMWRDGVITVKDIEIGEKRKLQLQRVERRVYLDDLKIQKYSPKGLPHSDGKFEAKAGERIVKKTKRPKSTMQKALEKAIKDKGKYIGK